MATEKPRYPITIDDDTLATIERYQAEHSMATRSGATVELLRIGIDEYYKQKNKPATESGDELGEDVIELATKLKRLDAEASQVIAAQIDLLLRHRPENQ